MNDQLLDKCNSIMSNEMDTHDDPDDRSPTSSVAETHSNGVRATSTPPQATAHVSTNGFATSTPTIPTKFMKRTPIFNLNEAITRLCNTMNNNIGSSEDLVANLGLKEAKIEMPVLGGSPTPKTQCPECGKHLRKREFLAYFYGHAKHLYYTFFVRSSFGSAWT